MSRLRISTLVLCAALTLAAFAEAAVAQEMAVVAKRVIYPGETVDAGALTEVKLRRSNRILTSIAQYTDQVTGKVAKRTLLPGKLIPINALRDAYMVEAGAPVAVSYVHGGLQISTIGIPLQPGAIGDMVKVRNADSGAVFTGIVMADGSIRVGAI
ncbi:flagellar basal body P-ring formation protein FlgA [Nitratireductor sp. CAU 1489]|uniref:Flagella basal body P-ring formation protein FlgA n=1 Tax=Nitratireductor arenosus TaxID=2682096 RepID=A0A844QMZ6_9HYPH|nr:flagellar basal body P-ring formation chaperone FlgA [Nitratireductor arenosus]MVA99310.1 flagellar basal body P-ring formation protein FlgA [Nitratireductor arenosus]